MIFQLMQTNIAPVSVFPSTANVLMIRSITLGPPPAYYYELQNVTVIQKTREVPNPNYVPTGIDPMTGEQRPAPAPKLDLQGNEIDQTSPTLAETYTETTVEVLKNGNVNMTSAQWDGWSDTVNDDEYQLDCISENLGLTRE